jgi:type I restriction enzyme S subunit
MSKIEQLIEKHCPNGVEFRELGEVCEFQRGTSITEKQIVAGDVPVIAGGQKPAYYHNIPNRTNKTITVSSSGAYAGFVSYWTIPIFLSDSFSVNPVKDLLPKYVFYFLKNIQDKIHKTKKGGGVPHVRGSDLTHFKIPIPPIAEQKRIAEVLGCWDDGIERLEKVIALKEQQKKWLMQRLLSGKTRLSGFKQLWKETKLGEILQQTSKRNKNLKIKQVLSITNNKGFILPKEQFYKVVASNDLTNYKIVQNGDFAYNPSRLNVGSIDRLDNFKIGVLSPMYIIFNCKKNLLSDYMKHWLKTTEFNSKVRGSAQGSVRETVDFNALSSIKIHIPTDLAEQSAIASILSEVDNEILQLNQKLSLFKQQKKWLMQQLLTGKKRLKIEEVKI